jgi:TonB family protein
VIAALGEAFIRMRSGRNIGVLSAAILGLTGVAVGEEPAEPSPATPAESGSPGFVFARPSASRVIPEYPFIGKHRGREGWVDLSFVVHPDGAISDPVVENSSGYPEFEQTAIKAILQERWQPATFNGHPVEQCTTRQRYVFTLKGQEPGARPEFAKAYKEAVTLLKAGKTEEASARIEPSVKEGTWNLYEASYLYMIRGFIQQARGDKIGALQSFVRANARLEPRATANVLREKFYLQTDLKQFAEALVTAKKLRNLKDGPGSEEEIDKVVAQIQTAIDAPAYLGFPGTIEYRSGCVEGRANYQHRLLRRKFDVRDIKGQADDLEIRCDRKRFTDKVSESKVYEVPAEWGECQVFVFGTLDTKLNLVEYPHSVAAEHDARSPLPKSP